MHGRASLGSSGTISLEWDNDSSRINCVLVLTEGRRMREQDLTERAYVGPIPGCRQTRKSSLSLGKLNYHCCLTRQSDGFLAQWRILIVCTTSLVYQATKGQVATTVPHFTVSGTDTGGCCETGTLYISLPPDWYGPACYFNWPYPSLRLSTLLLAN